MNTSGTARKTILAVDDDPHILEVLEVRLVSAGYDVVTASDGQDALDVLAKTPVRLVISDIRMPGMSGTRLQEEMVRRGLKLPIIFLTAHGSIPGAVEAIKHGAVDYLTKPFDGQELLARVAEVFAKVEGASLTEPGEMAEGGLVGKSQAMRDLAAMIERVAARDVNVLVLGESGTGKELVANLIHRRSPRKNGPLVTVDCGSTPAGLLESELFGHVKGAFTHAVKDKKGLIEQAHQGTLFLDEIGNISSEMQVRLLRVLENHKIRRIGDVREIQVDCRVIAATKRGGFRQKYAERLRLLPSQVPLLDPALLRCARVLVACRCYLGRQDNPDRGPHAGRALVCLHAASPPVPPSRASQPSGLAVSRDAGAAAAESYVEFSGAGLWSPVPLLASPFLLRPMTGARTKGRPKSFCRRVLDGPLPNAAGPALQKAAVYRSVPYGSGSRGSSAWPLAKNGLGRRL